MQFGPIFVTLVTYVHSRFEQDTIRKLTNHTLLTHAVQLFDPSPEGFQFCYSSVAGLMVTLGHEHSNILLNHNSTISFVLYLPWHYKNYDDYEYLHNYATATLHWHHANVINVPLHITLLIYVHAVILWTVMYIRAYIST